jgi:hypothetical protein
MRVRFGVWKISLLLALAFLFGGMGCATIPPMPPANFSEPGWTLRQGQAVWRVKADAPEIAGEILFATNPDGRTVLQFSKNPIPFVNVQTSNELWRVEFVPQHREFSGKGSPTPRLIWVHLARALQGKKTVRALRFTQGTAGEFTFENRSSGEMISGFLQ